MRLSMRRATETRGHGGKATLGLRASASPWLVSVAVVAWGFALGYAQGKPAPSRNVWDGVYSAAQAERGAALVSNKCSSCHGGDLSGGPGVPGLIGGEFTFLWGGQSAGALFDLVSKTMPLDAPATLTNTQYVDVLAAIFKENGFPAAAATELPPTLQALDDILIPKTKP